MSDAMRKKFESWYENEMPTPDGWSDRYRDGEYMNDQAQATWEAWQAALEHAGRGGRVTCQLYGHEVEGCSECTPPAPVVPDEMGAGNALALYAVRDGEQETFADGWNACRDAMLSSTPKTSNSEADQ